MTPKFKKTIIMEAGQQLDLSRENVSYAVTEVNSINPFPLRTVANTALFAEHWYR